MKQKYFIDSQKAATAIAVLIMIALYDQWENPTAWLYLALHGSYGILWLLKGQIFPDQAWETRTNLAFGLVIWASLSLYWVAPWLLVSRGVEAPGWYLAVCVSLYSFGLFAHFTSDMQKNVALSLRPNQLITDRMFAHTRNMNYFGELLIYCGFGLLAMHWLPLLILFIWVTVYWLPRMRKKDQVLAQYQDFADYKKRTKLFIPFLF